jgi:hypothetical protein
MRLHVPTPPFHHFLWKAHSPTVTISLAFDWLGVDLEVRNLCYWPTPQTGNQQVEEYLHSIYGRFPISPLVSSESLSFQQCFPARARGGGGLSDVSAAS